MADLIAQGKDEQQRWRRPLPEGQPLVLGREAGRDQAGGEQDGSGGESHGPLLSGFLVPHKECASPQRVTGLSAATT